MLVILIAIKLLFDEKGSIVDRMDDFPNVVKYNLIHIFWKPISVM